MALTAEQLKKYGLSVSDATKSDHDAGIVQGPSGNFYSIDGFERQQREGIDTDQGAVFSSSLEKDSGVDYTNFNTATDVEGALMELGKGSTAPPPTTTEPEQITYSPRLAHARARNAQYEEDRVSGQLYRDLYDTSNDPANTFLNRYKLKLGERLENGYYAKPDQAVTNNSKVGSGANGSSMDAAYYAKTGRDNRVDDFNYTNLLSH